MLPTHRVSTHPGELLREEFMPNMNLSVKDLAKNTGIAEKDLKKILNEEKGINRDEALALSRYFNTTPELWVGLQVDYDQSKLNFENSKK